MSNRRANRAGGPSRRSLTVAAAAVAAIVVGVLVAGPASAELETIHASEMIVPSDGGMDDGFFGETVSLDGDTAAIGAWHDSNANGDTAGAVYVYTRASNGSWNEQAKLIASDGEASDKFGTSVALEGDTLLIGARNENNANGDGAGAVYVFTRSGSTWTEQTKLTASDGAQFDSFGQTVALDGTTAAIAASFDDNARGTSAGSLYIFEKSGGTWTEDAKLIPSTTNDQDYLGFRDAVALDGDTVVVGAGWSQEGRPVYVFTKSGGSWSEQATLAPDTGSLDRFGWAVALEGDEALVASTTRNAAFLFERTGSTWSQTARLAPNDPSMAGSEDVALEGDRALIGDLDAENTTGVETGAAYTFNRSSGTWVEEAKLLPTGTQSEDFGYYVALQGDRTLVTGQAEPAFAVPLVDTAPPEALTATPGPAIDAITLDWSAPAGEPAPITYAIKRATAPGGPYTEIANTTSLSYTDAQLPFDTYHYVVTADAHNQLESAPSIEATAQPQPPPPPDVPRATAGGEANQIEVDWDAPPGTNQSFTYHVKRDTSASGPYTEVAATTAFTHTDEGLSDTTYHYVVTAESDLGAESAPSADVSAHPRPAQPENPEATADASASTIELTWERPSGALGSLDYRVHRSTEDGGPYELIAETGATSYTDADLQAGTYHYAVTAVDPHGLESLLSEQATAEVTAGAPPEDPDDAQNDAGTGGDASDDPDDPTILAGGRLIHINGTLIPVDDPIDAYGVRLEPSATRSLSYTFQSPASMALELELIDPSGTVVDSDQAPPEGGTAEVDAAAGPGEHLEPGVWVTVLEHGLSPELSPLPSSTYGPWTPSSIGQTGTDSRTATPGATPMGGGGEEVTFVGGGGSVPGLVPDQFTLIDYRDERECDPHC